MIVIFLTTTEVNISLFLPLMANMIIIFLTFLVLIYARIGYSEPQGNIVALGSRLNPQNSSSWLSPSGIFAFGFYKKADGFAVGIWLQTQNPEPIVTWTANRDDPPIPSDAYLEFSREGRLLLRTKQNIEDILNLTNHATSVSLLDSGNFVVYNGSNVLWQSFDYPTDTILGGQVVRLGYTLFSSVSVSDRSTGRFKLGFQPDQNPVAYPVNVSGGPDYAYWATGTLGRTNGGEQLILTETGHLYLNLTSRITDNVHTITQSSYNQSDKMTIYRATFDDDGNFRLYLHIFESSGNSTMRILWTAVQNQCEVKGYCGANSYCSFDASIDTISCFCFPGFIYVDSERKLLGCYRNFTYERFCGRKETSRPYNHTMLKNMNIGSYPYAKIEMVQEECVQSCMNDCNCWAALYENGTCNKHRPPLLYATQDQKQLGTALIKLSRNSSQSADEKGLLNQRAKNAGKQKRKMILILAPPFGFLSVLFTLLAVFSFLLYRKGALKYQKLLDMENLGLNKEFTLRSFSYNELEKATDGFRNEVGKISYGKIYEGTISEGNRKVSVKRLEKVDAEGEREFTAEMTVMGRIHHRNVIQLVGFCLEGAKKFLVYEFMTNRSLVDVLYHVDRRPFWKQRMRLAVDIARGIRYLHEDCDTHIVHCNIKPKNILVDDNWTAKICNFGSAKLLMPNQTENLVVEREKIGYSAPEWRKNASVSEKVDVYSYGVVLLEIICCTTDLEINVQSPDEAFSTKVYRYFKAKELRKLIGDEDVDMESLERMIKVGLCCIQNDPDLGPQMKNVILMLEGTLETPIPFPPTFSQGIVTPT